MGTKFSRTKPATERRNDLMDAAERLFLEYGVLHTTIDQITNLAKVAKGTFYIYFNSKEDVHAALAARFVARYVDDIRGAIYKTGSEDFAAQLSCWVASSVDGFLNDIDLVNMLFHAHPQTADGELISLIVSPLEELLIAGNARGQCTVNQPHLTATFLFSGLHGVIDDAIAMNGQIDRAELIRNLESLTFRALGLNHT